MRCAFQFPAELGTHLALGNVHCVTKGIQPGEAGRRELDDSSASVAWICNAVNQSELHTLIDELTHRLLAHGGAPGELGQARPLHVEISCQTDMSGPRLHVPAFAHEFKDSGFETTHALLRKRPMLACRHAVPDFFLFKSPTSELNQTELLQF